MRADPTRNLLLIQGTGERASPPSIPSLSFFDVDWMRGQSVGIFPLAVNSSPEPLIAELEKIV